MSASEISQVLHAGRLARILAGGMVIRWHTMGRAFYQTNAEHQWGAAAIALALHPDPSARLLKAIILHDCHEAELGDPPHGVKNSGGLGAIYSALAVQVDDELGVPPLPDPTERSWLHACDKLEAFFHLDRLAREGNSEARRMALRLNHELRESKDTPPELTPSLYGVPRP